MVARKNSIERIRLRHQYATNKRAPFYELAGRYFPEREDAVVIDIGAGYGAFADQLQLRKRYKNVYLLDADPEVARDVENGMEYTAPDMLPFESESVDFIHCSHMIEHFDTDDAYALLREMDRVLASNGVMVISAPLLQYRFYENLAHIRPYGPEGIIHHMCRKNEEPAKIPIAGAARGKISERYKVEDLVYRYMRNLDDSAWGSKYLWVSIAMEAAKKAFRKLGFARYTKNGYTLVIRKV